MTITNSYGYNGPLSEDQMALSSLYFGHDYGVRDDASWKVTAVTGTDRTVAVAAGEGYGHFVRDINNAPVNVALETIATGTRWDLIVCRRDWNTNTSSFTYVKGTAGTPGLQIIPALRAATPGNLDDQPLALVQLTAGQTQPTGIVDLRNVPGRMHYVKSLLAIPAPRLGDTAKVQLSPTDNAPVYWEYVLGPSGTPAWVRSREGKTRSVLPELSGTGLLTLASGWTNSGLICRAILDGNRVDLAMRFRRTGATISTDSYGNIADVVIGTLNAAVRPFDTFYPRASGTFREGSAGSVFSFGCDVYINPSGSVALYAAQAGLQMVQNGVAAPNPQLAIYASYTLQGEG